jgi:hypothetical protein
VHECAATAHSCTAFSRRPRGTERPALIQMARTLLCLARLCHCGSFVWICHASPPSLIPKSPARMTGPTHSIHSAGGSHPVHHNRRCMAHRHRTQAPAVSPSSRRLERCPAELVDPLCDKISVFDICFRWGFNDPAQGVTFSNETVRRWCGKFGCFQRHRCWTRLCSHPHSRPLDCSTTACVSSPDTSKAPDAFNEFSALSYECAWERYPTSAREAALKPRRSFERSCAENAGPLFCRYRLMNVPLHY